MPKVMFRLLLSQWFIANLGFGAEGVYHFEHYKPNESNRQIFEAAIGEISRYFNLEFDVIYDDTFYSHHETIVIGTKQFYEISLSIDLAIHLDESFHSESFRLEGEKRIREAVGMFILTHEYLHCWFEHHKILDKELSRHPRQLLIGKLRKRGETARADFEEAHLKNRLRRLFERQADYIAAKYVDALGLNIRFAAWAASIFPETPDHPNADERMANILSAEEPGLNHSLFIFPRGCFRSFYELASQYGKRVPLNLFLASLKSAYLAP